MGNCKSSCCGESDESKVEMKMDTNEPVNNRSAKLKGAPQQEQFNLPKPKLNDAKVKEEEGLKKKLNTVIKFQALWRGRAARKEYNILRMEQKGASRYFTEEEGRETLTKCLFQQSVPREKRPKHHYKSGATYEGEWKGGFRDGFGIQTWPDGAVYKGDWHLNRAHGRGNFIHVDGDVYEGEWANDKANGHGVYRHQNGAMYDGEWVNDLQHGKGVEKWNDGSLYDGEYSKGKKHGFGIYIWNDLSKYMGQWDENKISGIGVYSWLDGRMYKGEWKNNNMDGCGVYEWKDGRKYIGMYKNDKKHGYGVYYWADGRKYEGCWANGKQNGIGKYLISSEEKEKSGVWEDGKRTEWIEEDKVEKVFRSYFESQIVGRTSDLEESKEKLDKDESLYISEVKIYFYEPSKFEQKIDVILKRLSKLLSVFKDSVIKYDNVNGDSI